MSKTIIINEEMASELKDLLTMTQFKFKSNIKKFLAALLEDPTGAEPDMIFKQNGLDKNKLIKSLVDNKVITKKMTIDDHDENGNPHTAKMIVKYSVPKERFNERLDALYDILFPNVDAKINESLFETDPYEDSLKIIKNSPLTMGVISGGVNRKLSPEYGMGKFFDDAAKALNKKIEDKKLDEEGGGACAAACGGAPGDGGATSSNNSGQYGPIPLFGGLTVRKQKKYKKKVGGNPYTLNESQESKSIDAAKKLYMQRTGCSAGEADKFVRVDLRNDLPTLRDRNAGKFILGVTRMFLDRELGDASTIQNLNKTLKLVTQGHFNEYDRNLNGMSAQDIIQRFATSMKHMDDVEREELASQQFTVNNDYQIVRIDDFEQSRQYGQYTDWCVTHNVNMFNSYTHGGIGQFYFCLRNGFENEPIVEGNGCPLDSYGLSMVAVSVDENGGLNTCTCRWNHDNGGDDNIMDVKQISELIGRNFFEVFKPNGKWTEMVNNVLEQLNNGTKPEDAFDYFYDYNEGFAVVELKNKFNYIDIDNKLLSEKWFDEAQDFKNGFGVVRLDNQGWNFIKPDGQLLSPKQWFGEVHNFENGLAVVQDEDTLKFGFINTQGQLVLDYTYDYADCFENGVCRVKLANKGWNFINMNNEPLLPKWLNYRCVYRFVEGYACVENFEGRKNYINKNGELLSKIWFADVRPFHNGFGIVYMCVPPGMYYNGLKEIPIANYIKPDGHFLLPELVNRCCYFENGVGMVKLDNKYNLVNTKGQYLFGTWLNDIEFVGDGSIKAVLNGETQYIDINGLMKQNDNPTQNLAESVYSRVMEMLSEAVTGEDAEKAAAVYVYCLDDKEEDYCILCAKRLEGDEEGKWNPPMGHLHVGESPKDGAVRECEEESGVKLPKSKLQVGSYEKWGRNYWVILDGTIKDWPVGKGDGENSKFEWKNVYGIFHGKDKNLEWAWNTKDFIYQFAPAELDLD